MRLILQAAMFLIDGPAGRVLYTGDFRAEPFWIDRLRQTGLMANIAALYLDTTFATAEITSICTRRESIDALVGVIARFSEDQRFHLQLGMLGQEYLILQLAKRFNTQVLAQLHSNSSIVSRLKVALQVLRLLVRPCNP